MVRKPGVILLCTLGVLAAVVAAPQPAGAKPGLKLNKTFVTGLDRPWDVGFLPDRTMFFTENIGPIGVRVPGLGGDIRELVDPADVLPQGEGGMMGLAVDPAFGTDNRYIYTCFSSDAGPANDNRLVRWTVNAAFTAMDNREDIVTGLPYSTGRHSGCRPRFQPGSDPPALFVGTGDAAQGTNPQNPDSLGGKVLRIRRNGQPYPGNVSKTNALDDRIYTYGHRNVQGIAFQPGTSRVYSVEHGPGRDDEVNLLKNGKNYGWDPSDGGLPYNETVPMTDKVEFPGAKNAKWSSGTPTIAPSGATFLDGAQWEDWNGRLALAILKFDSDVGQHLRILKVRANGSINQAKDIEKFARQNTRLRSAVQGPDGKLYISTDETPSAGGAVWKVKAK